jgi:hypothetical protein
VHNGAGLRNHAFHWTGDAWHTDFGRSATLLEFAWTTAVSRSILVIRVDGWAWPGQSIYFGERWLWPDAAQSTLVGRLDDGSAPDSDGSRRQSGL